MTTYLRAVSIYLRAVSILVVLVSRANVFAAKDEAVPIGVARVDVTPDGPIRLTGYASRKTESEGVAQHLWVKALAIGGDAETGPAVLMTVDNCGVPAKMTAEVAGRLKAKAGVAPERFVVCSTHTHSGPWLPGFARALLDEPLPAEHRVHLERYQRQLLDKMEQAALAALAVRQPGQLAWRKVRCDSPSTVAPLTRKDDVPGWA